MESGFLCFAALPDGLVPHLRPASVSFPPRSPGEELNENGADIVAEAPTDLVKICEEHGND